MPLENKNAIICGAGGAVGGAVAHALARDGAAVFLVGRTLAPVRAVAEEISSEGGTAEAAQVEALDEQAITRHVAGVAATAGRIDILFSAIGMEDVQGTPPLDLAADDFAHPVIAAARTQFLKARTVARHMVQQRSGVIISITAEPTPAANLGGFMAACTSVQALWRGLACELGPHGIRLAIVRSAGSPDTPPSSRQPGCMPPRQACRPANTRPQWAATPCCGGFPCSPKSRTPRPSSPRTAPAR